MFQRKSTKFNYFAPVKWGICEYFYVTPWEIDHYSASYILHEPVLLVFELSRGVPIQTDKDIKNVARWCARETKLHICGSDVPPRCGVNVNLSFDRAFRPNVRFLSNRLNRLKRLLTASEVTCHFCWKPNNNSRSMDLCWMLRLQGAFFSRCNTAKP